MQSLKHVQREGIMKPLEKAEYIAGQKGHKFLYAKVGFYYNYESCKTPEDFTDMYNFRIENGEQLCYQEILRVDQATKVYIDAELKRDDLSLENIRKVNFDVKDHTFIKNFVKVLHKFFHSRYNINTIWEICTANSKTKKSYHIVSHKEVGLQNHEDRQGFKKEFQAFLTSENDELLLKAFDTSVYSSTRNIRMCYSYKPVCTKSEFKYFERQLLPLPNSSDNILDHLCGIYDNVNDVTFIKCEAVMNVPRRLQIKSSPLSNMNPKETAHVETILDKLGWYGNDTSIRHIGSGSQTENQENKIYYKLNSNYCPNVQEEHTQNTNYVEHDTETNIYTLKCFNHSKCACWEVNLSNLLNLDNPKHWFKWHIVYNEPAMRPYDPPEHGTMCIKAGMGLGKTQELYEYLREMSEKELNEYLCRNSEKSVLFITFRTILASKYEIDTGFQKYSEKGTRYDENRLIVCINSLWKMQKFDYDIVVLDEIDSIVEQFDMPDMSHKGIITSTLQEIMKQSDIAIFMDANVDSQRCKQFIKRLRPVETHQWVWNQYVRPNNRRLYLHKQLFKLTEKLNKETNEPVKSWYTEKACLQKTLTLLEQGKKVVFATTSRKVAEKMEAQIKDKGYEYKIYTRKTDAKQKEEDFKDVESTFSLLTVLIYNPALSAGISFTSEHFDALVGYAEFSMDTCSVTCYIQMLFRIRRLKDGDMHLYWHDQSTRKYITNREIIIENLEKHNEYEMKQLDLAYGNSNVFDQCGAFVRSTWNELFVDNLVEKHRQLNNIERVITNKFKEEYNIDVVSTLSDESETCLVFDTKVVEEEEESGIDGFTKRQWKQVCMKKELGQKLNTEERQWFQIGNRLQHYKIDFAKLDKAFIDQYVGKNMDEHKKASETLKRYKRYLALGQTDEYIKNKISQNHGYEEHIMEMQDNSSNDHYAMVLIMMKIFVQHMHMENIEFPLQIKHNELIATKDKVFPDFATTQIILNYFKIGIRKNDNKMGDPRYKNILKMMCKQVGIEMNTPECTEQITRNNPDITFTNNQMQEFMQCYEPTICREYKYLFMDE